MVQELTAWYAALDRHDDVEDVLARLVDGALVLNLPAGSFRREAGFREARHDGDEMLAVGNNAVVAGEHGPRINVYTADKLDPMPGSASL